MKFIQKLEKGVWKIGWFVITLHIHIPGIDICGIKSRCRYKI